MKNSNIEWTTHTFNPWIGCTKVSRGCLNCYAEARDLRFDGGMHWGRGAPRCRTSPANWREPAKWEKEYLDADREFKKMPVPAGCFAPPGIIPPHRPRVFCASLGDWLDRDVDPKWRHDLLNVIRKTPNLDWLLLSKRPENFERMINHAHEYAEDYDLRSWAWDWLHATPPDNVWIGASAEDQEAFETRTKILATIPAKVRFLSCEPLLGPIDLRQVGGTGKIVEWIICGGESGTSARRMEISWARDLRRQCLEDGIAFFMKQLGGERDKRGELADLPEDLRIRQFPL